jgi:hypothetical protein
MSSSNSPGYSLELNPDELLNDDFKQRAPTAAPACVKQTLKRTAVRSLRSLQK